MSSYQKVKDYIFYQLRAIDESNGRLNNESISQEISNVKKVIESGVNKYIASLGEDIALQDKDWQRIEKELDSQFNANWDASVLLQGQVQQDRKDLTWWTGKHQQECESYYWDNYRDYLNELPSEAVKAIVNDTDIIMNNIENPNINKFDMRGMVVGHVQSGKTSNYAGLICKAADAGYKFIVVISGTNINNLRNQTQKRLDDSFVGIHKGEISGNRKYMSSQGDKQPISLTSADKDFKKQDAVKNAGVLSLDNTTAPIFLVIKKNVTSLKNVIDWLNSLNKNSITQHAMLMIDDEADYASINYKDDNNPTKINKRLRELLALFKRSSYVGYTATPYANVFINHKAGNEKLGDDLFPRDFIYALGAPDNYFGAREVFLNSDRKYLVPIDDYQDVIPQKHKKDFELPTIPKSLYEAMRVFLLNIAIRNLRGQINKHNSMLIHATLYTAVHQKFALHIEQYINEIKNDIVAYGKLIDANQHNNLIQNLKDTLNSRYKNLEFSWNEVLECLCNIIKSVVIREVHQQTTVPLEYRNDVVTNAIVIGGTSLSRGYTLEGLSVSYFLRNTVFYDTLMQMGRWFGYREGYQDLCRVYMPETMIDNFGYIIEATEDLIDDFKKMRDENMTPKDFGLAVRSHPDSLLQITARNKQRNVTDFTHSMCLDGRSKETSWLSNNANYKQNNLLAIEKIITQLQNDYQVEKIGNNYLWRNTGKNLIIDLLSNFKFYQNDAFGISSRMPINFIKKYAEDIETSWDIAVYSGGGSEENIHNIKFKRERRKIKLNNDCIEVQNRQVSTGTSESITFDKETRKELGSSRKQAREKLDKPLLRLHIIETKEHNRLAAFGVSFPTKIISNTQNISLKINTVYQQNLPLELEEEQADDY